MLDPHAGDLNDERGVDKTPKVTFEQTCAPYSHSRD
jgi:hypothetical protein